MIVYQDTDFIEAGKNLYVFRGNRRQGDLQSLHKHEFVEIVYTISGRGEHTVDGRAYETERGDLLLIDCGSSHAFVPKGAYSYINVCLSVRSLSVAETNLENAVARGMIETFRGVTARMETAKLTFYGDERREVESLLLAMIGELRGRRAAWDRVAEHYLAILITRIERRAEALQNKDAIEDKWRDLAAYIDKNLDADLSLSTLSARYFYNPSYFSRAFKEKFQTSLVEYVTHRRVELAVRLLEESELSIDAISAKAGFSDRSSFYRAFSKYENGTPSDYRSDRRVKK